MADNLDLRGSVDIDVAQSQRALDTLVSSLERVTRVQAEFNDMSTAQARVSRTLSQNAKQQADSILSLARAYTETQKAAAIASDTQIRSAQAAAKAAEDSARRQTTASKAAAAQNALGFNATPLKTAAVPALSPDIKPYQTYIKQVVAADKQATDARVAASTASYTEQFRTATRIDAEIAAAGRKAAASEFAARTQFAQASFNDELKARRVELTQMRSEAQSAFKDLSPQINLDDVGQLNQLRYQLYDIATAAGVMGAAFVGSAGFAVKTATEYEAAFTTVARTVEEPVDRIGDLKQGLLDLSETIPVSTTQLAQIEALGAQLGISRDSLTQFTETTAQFASVSGVTEEQVANSFGAIFNLTKAGSENFERLASSINYVGINSVATDAEILKMTEEISASTTQAGYAADQTVGFAAALASLRIQPEQARGVVLRLFSDIDNAVSKNGTDLKAYADQLGLTSKAAAELWKSDPSQFTDRLIKTLSTAGDLNGAIRDLGITQTRETNVLQRLAGNYDVYAQSVSDASSAYAQGTSLSEAYAKTQDTLASRLQILLNTFQNLAARFGETLGEQLKPVITFISQLLGALSNIPAPMFTIVTAATALLGIFALIIAAGAGLLGTLLAIAAAFKGFKAVTGETTVSFAGLSALIKQIAVDMGLGAAASRIMSASLLNLKGSSDATSTSLRANVVATDTAAVANRGFAASAKSVTTSMLGIPFVNIIAALSILVPLAISFAQALGDVKNRNAELAQSLLNASGGMEGFTTALQKDTAEAAGHTAGLRTIKVGLDDLQSADAKAAKATADRAATVQSALGISDSADASNRNVTDGLKEQTLVIGDNAKAWVANALAQQAMSDENSAIYKFFNDPKQQDAARKYGIDIQQAISDGLGTKGGIEAALQKQFDAAEAAGAVASKRTSMNTGAGGTASVVTDYGNLKNSLTDVGGSVDGLSDKLRVQQGIQAALGVQTQQTTNDVAAQDDTVKQFQATLSNNSLYANSLNALQQSLEQNGTTFNEWSASGIANIQALQDTLNASVTAGAGLGLSAADSMVSSLASIDVSTDQIKSIVNTLNAANPELFADMDISAIIAKTQQVQAILKGAGFTSNAMLGGDVLGAQQAKLSQLISQRDAIQSQLKSQQGSAAASGNTGRKAAPKQKQQKAPELKTATEYAQDLGTAMQEAFSKKYGVQQSMDEITKKFADLRDRIQDARDQIKSINADLRKLASDRNILQIQLKVATDYGDTTRADAIRAELAQNSSDTAGKQKDLAKATADASTALSGNTAAAIANRAAVLDLLTSYQQQIQSYAATGASTQQVTAYAQKLRGEFISQLTQLGYNGKGVLGYATTFDTLTAAIKKVPTHKEVKVTADTSQAMGGLNAVGNRIGSLSGSLSGLNSQIAATQGAIDKQKRANAINKQISDLQGQKNVLLAGPTSAARKKSIDQQIAALNAKLASGNFYRGGTIGGSSRPTSKFADNTTINAQVGEGVVNLDGMKMLGANGLNAINNQQNPFPPVIINNSQNSGNTGTLVVELSPIDRQLIAQGKNVSVNISQDVVARATNAANLNTASRGANG